MINEKPKLPSIYIYLDVDGIDSLYAQIVERLETEFTQSREKDKNGRVKGNIGLPIIGAETELSIIGKHIDEVKTRFTSEQKLSALINAMQNRKGKEYFEHLPEAAIQSMNTSQGVFINVALKFNMPQFSPARNGVVDVNRDESIVFVIGPIGDNDHDYDDTYFKKTHYTFLMSASLNKTTRSKNGMRPTGHDAVFFRAFGGKDVPLSVFGYLVPLSKYTYQIKPYSIWL